MKKISALLFVLVFISGKTASAQNAPTDPYFIETRDTISKLGPRSITRDLLQDKNGNYWLATWQGIIRYDGKVFINYTLKENLIHFHVFSVYEDTKGNLWFGTVRGGLYCYDGKTFRLFTTKDGLPDNTVSSMLEDKNGNMWFATDKGVSRYNTSGNTSPQIFSNFTKAEGFSGVSKMIQDKNGKIWFGCQDGIILYDGKSFTRFTGKDSLPFKQVTSLLEDKSGNIWIGTFKGLFNYDGKSFRQFTELPSYLASYIMEDKKGNIWLSTAEPNKTTPNFPQQNLCRYDGKTFTRIVQKSDPDDCQVFGKIEDKDGYIWFGTMKGICKLDVKLADHPCVKKTCNHDLPLQKGMEEHKRELAKVLNCFRN